MAKAQADIIAAVIIIIIALGLTAAAYSYLRPLIEKRQDTSVVNRVFNSFSVDNPSSLGQKIKSVASSKNDDTFVIDADGFWKLYPYDTISIENNSIQFTFSSKVTGIIANQGWVPLGSTANCGESNGLIGIDQPFVVCGRADIHGDSYNVTIKTWFRQLDDSKTSPTLGSRILLSPKFTASNTSISRSVKISIGSVSQQVAGTENLIITEIKLTLG